MQIHIYCIMNLVSHINVEHSLRVSEKRVVGEYLCLRGRRKKHNEEVQSLHFFFNWYYNPSGFRPAQLSLSILSRKVLQSVVASGTSNPQLGGEPRI
jgi:hypothetical protein